MVITESFSFKNNEQFLRLRQKRTLPPTTHYLRCKTTLTYSLMPAAQLPNPDSLMPAAQLPNPDSLMPAAQN